MEKVKAKLKNKHVTTLSFANVAFDVVDGMVEIPAKYITDEFKHLFEEVLEKEAKAETVEETKEESTEEPKEEAKGKKKEKE
ncbi:hypothetical protein [Veillonella sp. 3310]|uniref:hypothetical protein n=1 Tax=Veillonella sp. 3310 TaxID=2490956 RepID=UPI000FD66453|nr:hypothetical protein [Veillonella sp. 3310]